MIEGDLYGTELYYDQQHGWICRYKPGYPTLAMRHPRTAFFVHVVLPTLILFALYVYTTLSAR